MKWSIWSVWVTWIWIPTFSVFLYHHAVCLKWPRPLKIWQCIYLFPVISTNSKLGSDAPRYKQVKNLLKSQSALSKLLQGCLIQVPLPYSNSDASGASKEMALYNTSRFYYCSIVLVGIPHTFFFSKVYKSYVPNVLQILARGGDRFYSRGKEGRQQLELSL